MEISGTDIQVNCSKHPTERIQRINSNINSKYPHIFCLECLVENQQQSSQDLLNIPEFLAIAQEFYTNNQPATEYKAPPEYISLLDEERKALADLMEHLLQEKLKIGQLFDQIKTNFIESLEVQRTEYYNELDQQLENLQYWNVFFEKKLRATYSDPTFSGSLPKTLEKIKDPKRFEAYIRSIKEDLNEEILKINSKTKPFDQDKKFKLPSLYKKLVEFQSAKPVFNIVPLKPFNWMDRKKPFTIKTELENKLKDLFEKTLVFQDSIPDVLDHCKCPESLIIQPSQYKILKEWLPEEFRYQNLKLLYRGTRDGMGANYFHENCDSKGPTLVLLNCTFYYSAKESIIGGFLDKDWNSKGEWIESDQAFLFSLTAKVKCVQKAHAKRNKAAYGNVGFGPTFGSSHELCLDGKFCQNYVTPSCFENSDLLIDRKNQEPLMSFEDHYRRGMNYFDVNEIEVYTFK